MYKHSEIIEFVKLNVQNAFRDFQYTPLHNRIFFLQSGNYCSNETFDKPKYKLYVYIKYVIYKRSKTNISSFTTGTHTHKTLSSKY